VVTGRYGTLGEVYYIEDDYWPLNTSLYVQDFKGNDPRFVAYFLTQLNFGGQNAAGAVPGVNRNHLHVMRVSVPDLPTQRRIAGILSAYDELIANNQQRIAILEEMARALYREWFVRYKAPGVRIPAGSQLPEGWEVKRLGDVAQVHRGRSYRSGDLADEGGLPFLNLKCMDREGGFRRTGIKCYIGEYKQHHVVRKGDIIMAVTDMTQERAIVARAAWVPTLEQDFGVMSMDLVRIEPKAELSKVFLYSFLRYSGFPDEVKQHANGANVLHLSPDRIIDYPIVLPTAIVMNKFEQAVIGMLELKDTLENQSANLRRTRDLLLPRLMSGRVEVV